MIRRGQRSGEFGDQFPIDWLLAAIVALAHAAADEVAEGRISADDAWDAAVRSTLRILRPH